MLLDILHNTECLIR